MDCKRKVMRVGLTGGIASGKSTVAELFAELGVPIVDTDVVAREVVAPGQAALAEIRDAFGEAVISHDGELDRAVMRSVIFTDDRRKRQLETILHPRIQAETLRQADVAGGDYQLIVVPLLAGSPLKDSVDRVLLVDCSEQAQIRRLLARDAESMHQARRILAAQASREERLAIADEVITNDSDFDAIRYQVSELHEAYLALAAAR